jgi:hypothetical protein
MFEKGTNRRRDCEVDFQSNVMKMRGFADPPPATLPASAAMAIHRPGSPAAVSTRLRIRIVPHSPCDPIATGSTALLTKS